MNYLFLSAIFITGAGGLMAQVLLLRELLIVFFGNELVLGVILSNWLLCEAAGAYIIGKRVDRSKSPLSFFIILQFIFSFGLFLSVYLTRCIKGWIGAEAVGLILIFPLSLAVVFTCAFSHGGLFSAGCRIFSIGKAYVWEAAGALAGSILLTFILITRLNTFQIIFLIAAGNFLIVFLLAGGCPARSLRYLSAGLLIFCVSLFFFGGPNSLQRASLKRQWRRAAILDYRNSNYGNIVVTKEGEQYTFFYNGLSIITAPFPDKQFVEDFGNFALLFHPAPKEAAILGGGAGGLIAQILKHPIERLDYAELDPLLIDMLREYRLPLVESELGDKRVHVKSVDARFFLQNTKEKYDVIFIGLPKPSDLSSNRLFTREFFLMSKEKLKDGGMLTFWLPGSFTYLSRELKGLNACILNTLKDTYKYTRVIPGDYNIILACNSESILNVAPEAINSRIEQRKISAALLTPQYLNYRLSPQLQVWYNGMVFSQPKNINSDFRPFALFEALSLWNRQFSKKAALVYEAAQSLNLSVCILLLFAVVIPLFLISRRKGMAKIAVIYSIFTTGFFGMLSSLLLILAFQVFYGYVYHIIGLLIGFFMFGTACGGVVADRQVRRRARLLVLFLLLETLAAVFSYFLTPALTVFLHPGASIAAFLYLFFACGFLIGIEFPLAAEIYSGGRNVPGQASGAVYGADLLGGWLAGSIGGIVLLPILGLVNACIIMASIKVSSVFLLLSKNKLSFA